MHSKYYIASLIQKGQQNMCPALWEEILLEYIDRDIELVFLKTNEKSKEKVIKAHLKNFKINGTKKQTRIILKIINPVEVLDNKDKKLKIREFVLTNLHDWLIQPCQDQISISLQKNLPKSKLFLTLIGQQISKPN